MTRSVAITSALFALGAALAASAGRGGEASFAAKPSAEKAGDMVRISFAVARLTERRAHPQLPPIGITVQTRLRLAE